MLEGSPVVDLLGVGLRVVLKGFERELRVELDMASERERGTVEALGAHGKSPFPGERWSHLFTFMKCLYRLVNPRYLIPGILSVFLKFQLMKSLV